MKESKNERVSSRAMESAMIIRLFKDALESDSPIVGSARWEQDDGPSFDLSSVEAHPAVGDAALAAALLRSRLGAVIGGDASAGDRTPIARLKSEDGATLDISLESFDQCALGDDGSLNLRVGSVERDLGQLDEMELTHEARLRLFGQNGEPLSREKALLPLRELQEIKRAERAAQERREEQRQINEPHIEDRPAGPSGQARSLLEGELQESSAPRGWGMGARSEQMLMALEEDQGAWGQGRERDEELAPQSGAPDWWTPSASDEDFSAYPLEAIEKGDSNGMSPQDARDMLLSAFASAAPAQSPLTSAAKPEGREDPVAPLASPRRSPIPAPEPELDEAPLKPEPPRDPLSSMEPARAAMDQGLTLVKKESAAALREQPLVAARSVAQTEPFAAGSDAARKPDYSARPGDVIEAPEASLGESLGGARAPAAPQFLAVSFEAPSDGFDEIAFAVEPADVGQILKELGEYPRFEARLTYKSGSRMMLALALPRGELALLNPLVERHAKAGVMIRRAKGK